MLLWNSSLSVALLISNFSFFALTADILVVPLSQREFETEQEQFKSLSYLSTDEQKKYKDRQSLAFMYMRPPGLEAALKREEDALKKKDTEQKDTQGESSKKQVLS